MALRSPVRRRVRPRSARWPAPILRVLGVASLARAAQFVEAFLALLVADQAGAGAGVVGLVLLVQQAGATFGAALAGAAVDRLGARAVAASGLLGASVAALTLRR